MKRPKIKKTKSSIIVEKPLGQAKDTLSAAKKTNKFSFKKLFHKKNKVKKTKVDNKEKTTKTDKEVSTSKNEINNKSTKKKYFFGLFYKKQNTDNNDTISVKNPNLKNIHK